LYDFCRDLSLTKHLARAQKAFFFTSVRIYAMLSFFRHSLTKRCYSTATSLPYTKIHVPVLLPEVLTHLAPQDGGVYCDMTFGDGGYTKAILGKQGHNLCWILVLI
jgi:hypothetical protein